MSLTFKDYKNWSLYIETCVISSHTTLPFIKVFTLNQKTSENSKFSTFDRSNLFLDRSKKWRNISQSHCLIWSILDTYLISQKEHSIDQKGFSIDWDNEEFRYRGFAWINRFSIPLQSIEKNIQSIESEFLIDPNSQNWIFIKKFL